MSLLESEGFARSDRLVGGDWIPPSVVPKATATGRDEWKSAQRIIEMAPAVLLRLPLWIAFPIIGAGVNVLGFPGNRASTTRSDKALL